MVMICILPLTGCKKKKDEDLIDSFDEMNDEELKNMITQIINESKDKFTKTTTVQKNDKYNLFCPLYIITYWYSNFMIFTITN